MNIDSKVTLEMKNIILRRFTMDDLEDFYEYASVDGVGQLAGWSPHQSIEESKQILENFVKYNNLEYIFAIVWKESGKVIGSFGIRSVVSDKYKDTNVYDLGYVLSIDYWGRGIMTEVCGVIIDYLFHNTDVELLTLEHFISNDKSKRVIEKNGFEYICQSVYTGSDGITHDCMQYSLSKSKYLNSKKNKMLKYVIK